MKNASASQKEKKFFFEGGKKKIQRKKSDLRKRGRLYAQKGSSGGGYRRGKNQARSAVSVRAGKTRSRFHKKSTGENVQFESHREENTNTLLRRIVGGKGDRREESILRGRKITSRKTIKPEFIGEGRAHPLSRRESGW